MEANKVYLNKLNIILVQILKREWPNNWETFISDIVGRLDDQTHDVLLDAFALVSGQDFPAGLDDLLEDLQGVKLGLLVLRELQNAVHPRPRVRVFLQRRQHILRQPELLAGAVVQTMDHAVQQTNIQLLGKVQQLVGFLHTNHDDRHLVRFSFFSPVSCSLLSTQTITRTDQIGTQLQIKTDSFALYSLSLLTCRTRSFLNHNHNTLTRSRVFLVHSRRRRRLVDGFALTLN